jgi:hypothetical protein
LVSRAGDFAEHPLNVLVLALLQHEDGNLESTEVGGGLAEAVRGFLTGVADKDDGVDLGSERLLAAVQ